ncbi:XRE family transcriptional regulator, partial [bacterium]|nr:XRE family transcriptional regulator [bacterium]
YDRTLKWLDSSVFASLKRNMEIDRLTGSRKTMDLFHEKELDEKNQNLVDSIVKQKKERAFYDNFHEMIELEYD